ncbi:MAG TPA: LanC-like protein [Gaiellaceae bacterium]|nr:LanC-like protein [Gaiellaceae bacterium]
MLYRPEAFDPLTERPWDEGWVRGKIARIVADAEQAYDPAALWPADEWDGWGSPLPLKTLYVGAAGMAWALRALRDRGHAEATLDPVEVVARSLEAWRETPGVLTSASIELPAPAHAALFHGETGILAVHWLLAPSEEIADRLHEHVASNVTNEAIDVFWGAPGTMLAARFLLEQTGHERWADAWRESADELLGRRDGDGLWTIRLHGGEGRGIGPAHGLVGNVLVLRQALDGPERASLERETVAALARTAVVEHGLANWPGRADGSLEGSDGEIRLQWCTGAPGVVVSAADYLDEELLLAGAELVWQAGPHGDEKGASICHGTAGNGYALLKTFERTGDERWLERARRFAVHALEQAERLKAARGRGRYSLWTGDVGTALFAADCLDGRARYPILDTWG